MLWFIGGAIVIMYLLISNEINSQKATDIHNHKVSLDYMLSDAYKRSSTKELEKKLKSIEERYVNIVDNGYKKYKSKYRRNTNETALFLDFATVFSLEEYEVIAMYDAIFEIISKRKNNGYIDRSYYKKIKNQLEFEFGIAELEY